MNLDHNFSIIGLTETKIKSNGEQNNFHLNGCDFYSQHTLSNADGTGFFVSKNTILLH